MSKRLKKVLLTMAAGVVLTIAGLAVPHEVDVSADGNAAANGFCGQQTQIETAKGYPLWYLEPDSSLTSPSQEVCNGAGMALATGTIAQHTPGHQAIFGFIQDTQINLSSLAQDFVIMTLIAIYPVNVYLNWRKIRS